MKSTLTAKGQTTIPKEVRDHLRVRPGDKLKYFINPDGSVVILPTLPITALKGILKSPVGTVSLEDMDRGIAKGATARYRRFLNQ